MLYQMSHCCWAAEVVFPSFLSGHPSRASVLDERASSPSLLSAPSVYSCASTLQSRLSESLTIIFSGAELIDCFWSFPFVPLATAAVCFRHPRSL